MRSCSHGTWSDGPDVDVVGRQRAVLDLAGDGLGLRDLLGLEALALEHVLEVHVAAHVELVGAVERQAPVLEQAGEDPVDDGRATWLLMSSPTIGTPASRNLRAHSGSEAMNTGMALTKRHPGLEAGLGVEALGLLGADREVADQHVGPGVAEGGHHVDRLGRRLLHGLAVVLAETRRASGPAAP